MLPSRSSGWPSPRSWQLPLFMLAVAVGEAVVVSVGRRVVCVHLDCLLRRIEQYNCGILACGAMHCLSQTVCLRCIAFIAWYAFLQVLSNTSVSAAFGWRAALLISPLPALPAFVSWLLPAVFFCSRSHHLTPPRPRVQRVHSSRVFGSMLNCVRTCHLMLSRSAFLVYVLGAAWSVTTATSRERWRTFAEERTS